MKTNYLLVLFLFAALGTNLVRAQSCPPTGFSNTVSLFFFYDTGTSACVDRATTVLVEGSTFTLVDCADTYSVYDLTSGPPLVNPNMFLANFGYAICEYTNGVLTNETLSVEQVGAIFKGIKIYPNPVINGEELTIKFSVPLSAEFNFYNVTGKHVLNAKSEGESTKTLNLNQFTNGIYFLQISSLGHTSTKKILVRH